MPHFAQFYKCALQVNPYCYSAYRGNSIKDEDEYNASILQKCKQYSIQVVGLANHGDVDSSESLRKLLSENGIVVFPGFEIMSAEKIHMVCLFPENKTISDLNRYLGALGLGAAVRGNETSSCTFEEIAQKVYAFGGFFYAAHITGENGILKLGKMHHLWKSPLLQAAQIPDSKENIDPKYKGIIRNTDPQYKREKAPAFINACDIEKPEDLERQQAATLIKMSEPSFTCFVLAFKDPESRVCLQTDVDLSYQSSINSLRVFGGYLDGFSVEFSAHLDTIIGGRGTGKSTIINLIRYALGKEPNKERVKEYNEMIEHNLGSGSRVEMEVTSYAQYGQKFKIIRRYKTDPVIEDANGNVTSMVADEILPNIEIYGQNEIVDVIKSNPSIAKIVSRLFSVDSSLRQTIDEAYKKLHMNTNEIIDCNKQIDNDESTVSDLPALKERLRFYREAGLEEKLPILRKMSTEEAAFNQVKKEIELFSPIKWPSLSTLKDDSKELLVLQQLVTEFNSQSEKIQTDYNALISWLSLEYAAIRGKWNKQSESYDEAIRDSLCTIEGIQDKSATDIAKDFSETIMKIKNAEPIQDRIDRQKEAKIRLLMKRKTLIESCKKSLDDYMECINKQVKKLNKNVFSNSIRISIEYRQVKDAVIAQLKTIKGVGDVSLTGFLQYSDFDIFTFADDIRKGKDILIEKYKFTGGIAEKIISHYDELSLLRMEEMQLDDIYHIELFVNGQFKPLERLSKGQQCTAILNILLVENKDPLIVDQPEDNLDNAFIADSLIASIRKNKLLRHYIFATHNANIPVFGDAELIVAMEEQDGKGRIIQGGIGSIDTPSVRDYAVQVLEGGREAFLMREKKYGIGEYNHFMNK